MPDNTEVSTTTNLPPGKGLYCNVIFLWPYKISVSFLCGIFSFIFLLDFYYFLLGAQPTVEYMQTYISVQCKTHLAIDFHMT